MKNLTITIQNFPPHMSRVGYRAMRATLDGKTILTDITSLQVVDFIERAIGETINSAVRKGEQSIDITVILPEGITLPPEVVAKFEADPIVNSITVS